MHRILVRHGLVDPVARRAGGEDYRGGNDRPMKLWQLDIVGGVLRANGTEAKVVTGVDDHSRFCVIGTAGAQGHRPRRLPRPGRRAAPVRRSRRTPLRSLPHPLTPDEITRIAAPDPPDPHPNRSPSRCASTAKSTAAAPS